MPRGLMFGSSPARIATSVELQLVDWAASPLETASTLLGSRSIRLLRMGNKDRKLFTAFQKTFEFPATVIDIARLPVVVVYND
ncbi:uncharacterized protein AtWU_04661 [Aspergillus tubingensis]|uniref:uncharacterized protein n=1 Tax=Aspergillus tubingensis TaxID=5068 RepID=UPI001578DBBE|nr:uncharacterized protein AtWU_04661 [Aspergillus tubingensis]GFN14861.1 hypothetical protein AtWU_04661 [Aspergillus tubingensis]